MNLVLLYLIGAGVSGLFLGLVCFLHQVIKKKSIQVVVIVTFFASVLAAIAASIYTNNTYGSSGALCVVLGYIVNIILFYLSTNSVDEAE